ncbi:hypothetical protein [Streptomyces oceani]|uniref:Uncharacterized protein n=1 Tax=Streptomyces oceani TaxID=1075402 RepID=A0A1E7JX49_9ACTN|nr:hypothetical protein [Streptomyces oceani]OEU96179.1 hypothetical protein AN216_21775 [Streptomyces oceani]
MTSSPDGRLITISDPDPEQAAMLADAKHVWSLAQATLLLDPDDVSVGELRGTLRFVAEALHNVIGFVEPVAPRASGRLDV